MKAQRKISSSNFQNRQYLSADCHLSVAIEKISGRWKMQVLYSISYGDASFSAIKKRLSGISGRMLGLRLDELSEEKFIKKSPAAKGSSYTITPRGKKCIQLMEAILKWDGRGV